MKKYIIYYYEPDETPNGCVVIGSAKVHDTVKWIYEIGGRVGQILKQGKNFEFDCEDVIDVTASYVKNKLKFSVRSENRALRLESR